MPAIAEIERFRILEEKLAEMTARAEKAELQAQQLQKQIELQAQEIKRLKALEEVSAQAESQVMAILLATLVELKQVHKICLYEDKAVVIRLVQNGLRMLNSVSDLTGLTELYAGRIQTKAQEAERSRSLKKIKSETQKLQQQIKKKQKEIKPKEARLAKADAELSDAAKTLSSEGGEQTAAKRILETYEEVRSQDMDPPECNLHGKVAVEQLKKAAPATATEEPQTVHCPHCNEPMISTEQMQCCARSLIGTLSNIVENTQFSYPVYTCRCGHVHLGTERQRVPVTPTRTMTQELVIEMAYLLQLGLPLERIGLIINAKGLQIGSSTLAENLSAFFEESGGSLLVRAIESVAQKEDSIVADGTPIRILQQEGVSLKLVMKDAEGKDVLVEAKDTDAQQRILAAGGSYLPKQAYLELVTSAPNADKPFAIYYRMDSRSTESIHAVLKDYSATNLTTDGLVQYEGLVRNFGRKVHHQSCLVHFLREVLLAVPVEEYEELARTEAGKKVLAEKLETLSADMRLNLCAKALRSIFALEAQTVREPNETLEAWRKRLLAVRQAKSVQLMDDIEALLSPLTTEYAVQAGRTWKKAKASPYASAIVYYLNQKDKLRAFLSNAELPVDSNAAERCIRAVAVLRSACHYKQSRKHTDIMCQIFTLFETARMAGIEHPVVWLKAFGHAFFTHCCDVILTQRAKEGMDLTRAFTFTDEARNSFDIEPWLPWNYAKRTAAEAR